MTKRWRYPGAGYGALIAVSMFVVLLVFPHPLGARLFWSAAAIQLTWGASLVWSRTRLPWATASLVAGAAGLALWAAMGISPIHPESHNLAALLAMLAFGAAGSLLLRVEKRAHPAEWEAWRRHAADCSLRGVLLGRHIPRLR